MLFCQYQSWQLQKSNVKILKAISSSSSLSSSMSSTFSPSGEFLLVAWGKFSLTSPLTSPSLSSSIVFNKTEGRRTRHEVQPLNLQQPGGCLLISRLGGQSYFPPYLTCFLFLLLLETSDQVALTGDYDLTLLCVEVKNWLPKLGHNLVEKWKYQSKSEMYNSF